MSTTTPSPAGTPSSIFRPRVVAGVKIDRSDDTGQYGGDHVILVHPNAAYWALTNESGLLLAGWCDGTRSVADLAVELAAVYPAANAADLIEDTRAFVASLAAANLLECAPADMPAALPAEPYRAPEANLAIFLTEQCNLRCRHCFVVEGTMPDDTLTTAEVLRLIDEHTSLHDRTSITFSGGEVTLHPDWLDILDYACARSRRVILCTNGLLMTPDSVARLARLPVEVQVSLDGADPAIHDFIRGKGSFEKTWAALEMMAAANAGQLIVSSTMTRCLLDDVRALVERIEALGIPRLRFLPLLKERAAATHWGEIAPDPEAVRATYRWLLFELPRLGICRRTQVSAGFPGFVPNLDPRAEAWCPLGRMTLVNARGEAYNCPSMLIPDFKTGDIRTQSLAEIQRGEANEGSRRMILERRFAVPACAACAWRSFCQGSCTALSFMKTQDYYTTDEYCEFRRELYRRHALAKVAR